MRKWLFALLLLAGGLGCVWRFGFPGWSLSQIVVPLPTEKWNLPELD